MIAPGYRADLVAFNPNPPHRRQDPLGGRASRASARAQWHPTARRPARVRDAILAPRFIDVQVNGGGGVLLNDQPTEDGMRADGQLRVFRLSQDCCVAQMGHAGHPAIGRDRLMLITDAMPLVGTNERQFMLHGRQITLLENRLTRPDGTLAGALLTMIEAVRNVRSAATWH